MLIKPSILIKMPGNIQPFQVIANVAVQVGAALGFKCAGNYCNPKFTGVIVSIYLCAVAILPHKSLLENFAVGNDQQL